jgi:hypothetical protein
VNCFKRKTLPTVNRKYFFMNILCIESFFFHRKLTTEHCSSLIYSSNTVSILLLNLASEHAHARLLPRLSWSRTVLLPSDTYRKPMTSITAVLLLILISLLTLLTLPRTRGVVSVRTWSAPKPVC